MNLQQQTEVIRHRTSSIQMNFWDIGRDLNSIKNSNLFKEKYETLKEYIETEFDFTIRHAERMMKLADEYKSDTVSQIGLSKLYLILQVPQEQREELIKEVTDKKLNREELSKKVNRLKGAIGTQPFYSSKTEEYVYKLKREFSSLKEQFDDCKAIRDNLRTSIEKWLDSAKKYSEIELNALQEQSNKMLKQLSE